VTTTVILNLVLSILAVGALAALTRLAALVAGGRFDEPAPELETPYELERAA